MQYAGIRGLQDDLLEGTTGAQATCKHGPENVMSATNGSPGVAKLVNVNCSVVSGGYFDGKLGHIVGLFAL